MNFNNNNNYNNNNNNNNNNSFNNNNNHSYNNNNKLNLINPSTATTTSTALTPIGIGNNNINNNNSSSSYSSSNDNNTMMVNTITPPKIKTNTTTTTTTTSSSTASSNSLYYDCDCQLCVRGAPLLTVKFYKTGLWKRKLEICLWVVLLRQLKEEAINEKEVGIYDESTNVIDINCFLDDGTVLPPPKNIRNNSQIMNNKFKEMKNFVHTSVIAEFVESHHHLLELTPQIQGEEEWRHSVIKALSNHKDTFKSGLHSPFGKRGFWSLQESHLSDPWDDSDGENSSDDDNSTTQIVGPDGQLIQSPSINTNEKKIPHAPVKTQINRSTSICGIIDNKLTGVPCHRIGFCKDHYTITLKKLKVPKKSKKIKIVNHYGEGEMGNNSNSVSVPTPLSFNNNMNNNNNNNFNNNNNNNNNFNKYINNNKPTPFNNGGYNNNSNSFNNNNNNNNHYKNNNNNNYNNNNNNNSNRFYQNGIGNSGDEYYDDDEYEEIEEVISDDDNNGNGSNSGNNIFYGKRSSSNLSSLTSTPSTVSTSTSPSLPFSGKRSLSHGFNNSNSNNNNNNNNNHFSSPLIPQSPMLHSPSPRQQQQHHNYNQHHQQQHAQHPHHLSLQQKTLSVQLLKSNFSNFYNNNNNNNQQQPQQQINLSNIQDYERDILQSFNFYSVISHLDKQTDIDLYKLSREYVRFIILKILDNDTNEDSVYKNGEYYTKLIPSPLVDLFWRSHILHTSSYRMFLELIEINVGYEPNSDSDHEQRIKYDRTLNLYKTYFKPIQPNTPEREIWPTNIKLQQPKQQLQ